MKTLAIALNTFRESVRDRVLYNLVLFVVLLVIAAVVMGRIAVGQEAKIIVDVGLSAMTIFGVLIGTLLGIGLVAKEIEKRTLASILAKPVRRATFLLGKYLGLSLTLLVNTALMATAITLALVYAQGDSDVMPWRLWSAAYAVLLELLIITAVALLFACFTSPALAALFTLLVFLIGRWSLDLKLFAETSNSAVTRGLCRALYYLLPNLANFNLINQTAHGQPIAWQLLAGNTVYAACYVTALLAGAVLIFERRNFK